MARRPSMSVTMRAVLLAGLLLVPLGCDFSNDAVLELPFRGCCAAEDGAAAAQEVERLIASHGYRERPLEEGPGWTFYGADARIRRFARPEDTYANRSIRVVVPAHGGFMHVWIMAFNTCLDRVQLELALTLRRRFASTFLAMSPGCPDLEPELHRAVVERAAWDELGREAF